MPAAGEELMILAFVPGKPILLLFCLIAVLAGMHARPAGAAPGLLVGVDDDTVKWKGRPNGFVSVTHDLGFDALRITIPWRRGRTQPPTVVKTYLHRVAMTMKLGQRVVLAVYGPPEQAPRDARERAQYCAYLVSLLKRIPVRDVVIWNEANSPDFWPRSLGARGYEALLAASWDSVHALRGDVNVISTTAAHYDPALFLRRVGAAYRSSGRRRPLVDTFGHNPYPDFASEPPWVVHSDKRTIGQGDLGRLLTSLRLAFEGTGQPLPGGGRATVWYLEDGFQTTIAKGKHGFYVGRENDPFVVPPLLAASGSSGSPLDLRDQAGQLRDALELAYCQPTVGAFFNFQLLDEKRLSGWQSGLLWRDGTRKPSYGPFKTTVALVHSGAVDCASLPSSGA
jgi:hypothetical protein